MEKELVKVGMKVSINEQLYSKVSKEKYPENKFYVLSLVENTDYTYYVSDTEGFYDYKTFSIDCADFEPYEEPKEKLRLGLEGFRSPNSTSIDLDALEHTTYQVKDLEGNVIEENAVDDNNVFNHEKIYQQIKELSPITQEFIESFGFVKVNECKYNFISQEKDSYFLEAVLDKFSLYAEPTAIMGENKEYIFQDFTCTTQSELRFLLTKGRIDCSK